MSTPDSPAAPLRETLLILEDLLDTLTESANSPQALQTTVDAARAGLNAEVAFWYSKTGTKAAAVSADIPISADECYQFARKLLSAIPAELEVFRWVNTDPPRPDTPTAALVARLPRVAGCLVAVTFVPGRRFDLDAEEIARMSVKLLVGLRAHAQFATKSLLNGLIHSLTAVLDAKDTYTAGHSERVARIAVLLGKQMGLSESLVGDLFLAGLLHDLGKIGIRDEVLWKPGKLSAAEFDEIKQHPAIGEKIVASIEPFKRLCPAVRGHHERWDGGGYPDGLRGEAIPLLARVLAVADTVDAMMSPRRYRPARSPIEIDRVMADERGRQFDPALVDAFMGVRVQIYPPIYQKGIGESAFHAIELVVGEGTETSQPLRGG